MTVVAAENMWGDIASQIGGSHVAVTSIISDPNADPHQYETDPKDAAAISRASIVIENGLGYDDFIDKLLGTSPGTDREVVSIARTVGAGGDNANPHLWYSPSYVTTAARALAARFAAKDPADAAAFRANLAAFLSGEQQVTSVIDTIRTHYAGTPIAYTERVPGYLVQAAGLKLATPASFSQSIEDGDDPSPRDTATFDAALKGKKVKVLLYNGQVTSPVTQKARSLATTAGIPVLGVTETLPPNEKNFQTWQGDQAKAILAALGG
jgi:zinc/manganese transport system substrate-binding protein